MNAGVKVITGTYSAKMAQLRLDNPKAWRKKVQANRSQCKQWARANAGKVTARVRRWQLENPQRFKAQQRRYYVARKVAKEIASGQTTFPLAEGEL